MNWQDANNRGSDLFNQGQYEAAEAEFKQALLASNDLGDTFLGAITELELARVEFATGRLDEAKKERVLGLEKDKRLDEYKLGLVDLHLLLGRIYAAEGDQEKYVGQHRLAVAAGALVKDEYPLSLLMAQIEFADTLVTTGQFAEATQLATELQANLGTSGDGDETVPSDFIAESYIVMAEAHLFANKPDAYKTALAVAQSEGGDAMSEAFVAKAAFLQAVALIKQGESESGRSKLEALLVKPAVENLGVLNRARAQYWIALSMGDGQTDAVVKSLMASYTTLENAPDLSGWFEPQLRSELGKYVAEEELPPKIFHGKLRMSNVKMKS